MQKIIIWRKWQDPLMPSIEGDIINGFEPDEDEDDSQFHKAQKSFCDDDDDDECSVNPSYAVPASKSKTIGPCVYGPRGIVPLHESNLPSTLFNFWMGHANFDITPDIRETIAAIPGVETLDVFTRYRFRLGVGRAFSHSSVKWAIEKELCPPEAIITVSTPPLSADGVDSLAIVKSVLNKTYPFWAIVILPSKVHKHLGGGTAEEVLEKLKRYEGQFQHVVLSWKVLE